MCDDRAVEKTRGSRALGAIDDLGCEADVAGADVFAEGSDGAEGEDGTYAEVFEGGDVGAGGDGGGGEGVVFAVARDEGDEGARREGAEGDGRRGGAPGLVSRWWVVDGEMEERKRDVLSLGGWFYWRKRWCEIEEEEEQRWVLAWW